MINTGHTLSDETLDLSLVLSWIAALLMTLASLRHLSASPNLTKLQCHLS